jgi:hypothetical protein
MLPGFVTIDFEGTWAHKWGQRNIRVASPSRENLRQLSCAKALLCCDGCHECEVSSRLRECRSASTSVPEIRTYMVIQYGDPEAAVLPFLHVPLLGCMVLSFQ